MNAEPSVTDFKAVIEEVELQIKAAQASQLDLVERNDGSFHILHQNKSFRAKILQSNFLTKTYQIEINGNKYEVQLQDQYDLLVNKMGLSVANTQKVSDIKAPMPGLVLSIETVVGQQVEKGTPLLILEAMKMENIIKSTGEGIIKSIAVTQGEAIEKGQLLIEME